MWQAQLLRHVDCSIWLGGYFFDLIHSRVQPGFNQGSTRVQHRSTLFNQGSTPVQPRSTTFDQDSSRIQRRFDNSSMLVQPQFRAGSTTAPRWFDHDSRRFHHDSGRSNKAWNENILKNKKICNQNGNKWYNDPLKYKPNQYKNQTKHNIITQNKTK